MRGGGSDRVVGTIAVDRAFEFELIPRSLTGGPGCGARDLSTVAASMVSLAALVLTITMVVVQLAMGQFSPRIVQNILRDKASQFAIGIFVATFAHAMLAMRKIEFGTGQVPGLAILVAFVLVLVSIAVLVLDVNHIGRSLRVSRGLHAALEDLRTVASPPRQVVLDEQLRLLIELTDLHLDLSEDVHMASRSDPQGVGVAAN